MASVVKYDDLTHKLEKYLLRGIYEVYNKGSNAESKYEHHLEQKENRRTILLFVMLWCH